MVADRDPEESFTELMGRLADDTKSYVAAEAAYYRVLAAERWNEARAGLIFGGAALGLGMGAAIALVLGLELILLPILGPIWATLAVVLVSGGAAGLFGWLAVRRLARAFAAPGTEQGEQA